jgi:putative hydrolase of the HAD superfamily
VRGPNPEPARHAAEIWHRLGPASLALFPEVTNVLGELRQRGYAIAIVSNWQCGLVHFCTELGLASFVDHVIASADVGCAKPNREMSSTSAIRWSMTSKAPPERASGPC